MCNALKFKTLPYDKIQTKKCDDILQAGEAAAAEEARRAVQKVHPEKYKHHLFHTGFGGRLDGSDN